MLGIAQLQNAPSSSSSSPSLAAKLSRAAFICCFFFFLASSFSFRFASSSRLHPNSQWSALCHILPHERDESTLPKPWNHRFLTLPAVAHTPLGPHPSGSCTPPWSSSQRSPAVIMATPPNTHVVSRLMQQHQAPDTSTYPKCVVRAGLELVVDSTSALLCIGLHLQLLGLELLLVLLALLGQAGSLMTGEVTLDGVDTRIATIEVRRHGYRVKVPDDNRQVNNNEIRDPRCCFSAHAQFFVEESTQTSFRAMMPRMCHPITAHGRRCVPFGRREVEPLVRTWKWKEREFCPQSTVDWSRVHDDIRNRPTTGPLSAPQEASRWGRAKPSRRSGVNALLPACC